MIESSSATEILNALGLAIFERNADGTFTLVGKFPAWTYRFGLSKHVDFTREHLIDAFPLLDTFLVEAEEVWEAVPGAPLDSGAWIQSDLSGETCTLQATAISASGQPFLLLNLPGAQFEQDKAIIQRARSQSMAHDRMERRVTNLESRNREVERLNRLKGEFLASMSHELRTPLNAIIGFSTLLVQEKAGSLNDRQKGFVGEIGQAASHLLNVINDILDISKVEAGRLELQPEAFSLGEGLSEVLSVVHPLAIAKGIEIQAEDAPPDLSVFADRVRFKQVLYNLLSNAIKFTPRSGLVSITARSAGPQIEITVSDNGPGIPLEEQELIFERFYQGTKAGFKEGTGLGLAITKRLVEQHGGLIRVDSAPGSGSRFSIKLPSGISD
jgi:signal transduction histidine kinase